jgi:DNA-binding NarL/FixJ family response regulator
MEVLIVDDHPFIHESLAAVARKAVPGARVHVASSLTEGVSQARGNAQLRLVLLDLGLPGCSGIEALARFRAALPKLRVIVVSAAENADCVHAVFAAGAAGFIPKTMPPPMMVATVRLIAEGGTWFPPEIMAAPPEARKAGLTERQAAVLRLLVRGLGNQQIAKKLDISENTVKQHTHALYGALKVSSRTQAIVAAARLGIKSD